MNLFMKYSLYIYLSSIILSFLCFCVSCTEDISCIQDRPTQYVENDNFEVIFDLSADKVLTKSFVEDDWRNTLWHLQMFISYKNNWSEIFDISPNALIGGKTYSENGVSIKYFQETRSFRIAMSFPKRNNPQDYKVAMCGMTYIGTEATGSYFSTGGSCELNIIDNELVLTNSLPTYYASNGKTHDVTAFFLSTQLSDSPSWDDLKTKLELKPLVADIKVYSDSEDDKDFNLKYIHPTLYHTNLPLLYDNTIAYNSISTMTCPLVMPGYYLSDLVRFVYNLEHRKMTYEFPFYGYFSDSPFGYDIYGSNKPPTLEDNGRNFQLLAAFRTCFSESGELPIINFGNNDSAPSGIVGQPAKFLLLINNKKPVPSTADVEYRYAVIPLPEKMFPYVNYVIKNKPGVSFFSEVKKASELPKSSELNLSRSLDNPSVKILTPDDIIIEEQ